MLNVLPVDDAHVKAKRALCPVPCLSRRRRMTCQTRNCSDLGFSSCHHSVVFQWEYWLLLLWTEKLSADLVQLTEWPNRWAVDLVPWPQALKVMTLSKMIRNIYAICFFSFFILAFLIPCLGVNFLINSPSLEWPRKNASLNWPKVSWPIRPYPDIKFVTLIISIVELINLLLLVLDKIWLTSLGLDSMISKWRNGNPNGAITMSLYLRERFVRNTTEFKLKLEI